MKEAPVGKSVHFKPTLYLSERDLPALKDWEVGKNYQILLKVRQISKSEQTKTEYSPGGMNASFEIIKAEDGSEEMDDKQKHAMEIMTGGKK